MDVVVTGAGVVSPLGAGVAATWDGLVSGRLGITRAQDAASGGSWWWATVPDAALAAIDGPMRKRTDRFAQLALVAAAEAVADAGWDDVDPERTAVVVGSSMGGVPALAAAQTTLDGGRPQRVPPKLMAQVIPNMAAAAIALRYDLHGPQLCIASACASSLDAIGTAARLIERGEVDLALAGGSETLLAPVVAWSLQHAGALSGSDDPQRPARPFDVTRDGFVMGEGAGIVVLESAQRARRRDARVLGVVRGYASLADAYHVTSPEPGGTWEARAMERALADAGIAAAQIDALYAHGTATIVGDAAELLAINAVHGDRDVPLPVTSIKGHIGHGMAASGVTSVIAALRGLFEGVIVPTMGTRDVEPTARFRVVTGEPLAVTLHTIQINAFGFGGQNVSLVVSS